MDFSDDGQSLKLFAPGPVQVPDFILAEMAKPNDTHRTTAYQQLHSQLRSKMQRLLHTQNDVLFYTCSGSGVMEACVTNLLDESKNGMFLTNGHFGERWYEMACNNGSLESSTSFGVKWGKVVKCNMVKSVLYYARDEGHPFDVVFITMNESSTGVMNPIKEIAGMIKQYNEETPNHPVLLCVDAVSCMAGVQIKVDEWGIDVCLASTQKCFGVPPGLAVCSISERTLEYAKTVKNRGWYFDFLRMSESSQKDFTPATPNINCMRALNKALDRIFIETPAVRYARHHQCTRRIEKWALDNGFELFAPKEYRSNTICIIKNTRNIDVTEAISKMIEKGYLFANG